MFNKYMNTQTPVLHSPECDTYTYKNTIVKIITVFGGQKIPIALVEDKDGHIFEVPRNSLT